MEFYPQGTFLIVLIQTANFLFNDSNFFYRYSCLKSALSVTLNSSLFSSTSGYSFPVLLLSFTVNLEKLNLDKQWAIIMTQPKCYALLKFSLPNK